MQSLTGHSLLSLCERDRMANDDTLRDCRGYKEGSWRDQKGNEGVHDRMKPPLHITERIWLRYAPPKLPAATSFIRKTLGDILRGR